MTTIRRERPGDEAAIYEVNRHAFARKEEAEVVDLVRQTCPEGVSFVAEEEGRIVGHILFTPTILEGESQSLVGSGLAPLAVLPGWQGRGIGSALVRAGLAEMRRAGEPFVVVIGHSEYYPRFGFEPASRFGIRCEYAEVPDEAFMVAVFDEDRLQGIEGVAKERPEFAMAM